MRKWNALVAALILLLFLIHGILAGFQLLGVGNTAAKWAAWAALALIAVHTIIGVKLTADALRVWKKTGAPYLRRNTLFWARRVSGFAVMVLLAFHLTAFGSGSGGGPARRQQRQAAFDFLRRAPPAARGRRHSGGAVGADVVHGGGVHRLLPPLEALTPPPKGENIRWN